MHFECVKKFLERSSIMYPAIKGNHFARFIGSISTYYIITFTCVYILGKNSKIYQMIPCMITIEME